MELHGVSKCSNVNDRNVRSNFFIASTVKKRTIPLFNGRGTFSFIFLFRSGRHAIVLEPPRGRHSLELAD
jgi:hypothetical protein